MASLLNDGQLQNLGVRPNPDNKAQYCVTYGRRRLTAFNALLKAGSIKADFPIACRISEQDDAATYQGQIAENICRQAMHPMDEFEAFAHLAALGWSEDKIASHYGTTKRAIADRMAIGGATGSVRQAFRDNSISFDIVKIFAGCPDLTRQERVFRDLFGTPQANNIHSVRKALYQSAIEASDDLAVFVGLDTYEAAGGAVLRDLLSDEIHLTDLDLLADLRDEKLQAVVDATLKDGWKWVEATSQPMHVAKRGFRILSGSTPENYDALATRMDEITTIVEHCEDDSVPAIVTLCDEYERLSQEAQVFSPEDMAFSGVLVTLAGAHIAIQRGLVRQQDEPKVEAEPTPEVAPTSLTTEAPEQDSLNARPDDPKATYQPASDAKPNAEDEAEDKQTIATTPALTDQTRHTETMRRDLVVHRTATIRAQLLEKPEMARAMSDFVLVSSVFDPKTYEDDNGTTLTARNHILSDSKGEVDRGRSMEMINAYMDALPLHIFEAADQGSRFVAFLSLSQGDREQLIAAAFAVSITPDDTDQNFVSNFAKQFPLDGRTYFEPTGDNYFGHVSRDVLFETLDDCMGKSSRLQFASDSLKTTDLVDLVCDIFKGKRKIGKAAQAKINAWTPKGLFAPKV
jgi:ParB family chromosome partitioning protein